MPAYGLDGGGRRPVIARPAVMGLSLAVLALGVIGGAGSATASGTTFVGEPHVDALAASIAANGSFERPVVPAGGFVLFSPGTHFAGWRVVGATGNVGVVDHRFTQNGIRFPAAAGAQWLDLTGFSNTATGVAQTFATTIGARYTLSFAVGNVVNPGGIYGTKSTVAVKVNGRLLLSASNSLGAGRSMLVWKGFTVAFMASTTRTTVTLVNRDPAGDNSNGVDNVKVVRS